ncbi:MAG: prepilin-type N-terminal cleavage/methylation domain-containing protein [Lachnospiraceae bacterium]|nr:prepilin-type N-terminal cleavage/methylation domain-containing protein [Lachnospiraceae bacterium]
MRRLDNNGFSLLEIIVALAILSIVGTVIYNGFLQGLWTYNKATDMQNREATANYVAEWFNTHSLRWLSLDSTYNPSAVNGDIEFKTQSAAQSMRGTVKTSGGMLSYTDVGLIFDSATGSNYKVTDSNSSPFGIGDLVKDKQVKVSKISYTGMPINITNGDSSNPEFYVDVTLTPVEASKAGVGSTYKQTTLDSTGEYFQLAPSYVDENGVTHSSDPSSADYDANFAVKTNNYVVPDIRNMYDGDGVVVTDEINQYDTLVLNDIKNLMVEKIDAYNASLGATASDATLADTARFAGDFDTDFGYYYTGNTTAGNDIQKTTTITLKQVGTGADTDPISYVYVVTVEYEVSCNLPVYNVAGTGTIAGLPGTITVNNNSMTVTTSGSKYTVTYIEDLDSLISNDVDGLVSQGVLASNSFSGSNYKGSFGGVLYRSQLISDAERNLTNLYIIYEPFDKYSNTGVAGTNTLLSKDKVVIDGGTGTVPVNVYFVVQKVKNTAGTKEYDLSSSNLTLKNNAMKTGTTHDFQAVSVYTNSENLLKNSSNSNSLLNRYNYLTNSYGNARTNYYAMEIKLYKAATYDTTAGATNTAIYTLNTYKGE